MFGEIFVDVFFFGEGVSYGNFVRIKLNVEFVEIGKCKCVCFLFLGEESVVCVCCLVIFKFVFLVNEICCIKYKRVGG